MRSRPPQQTQPARKPVEERILETAHGMFAYYGVRRPTLREIAENAGTNVVTVLQRFGSKDKLILEYLTKITREERRFWPKLDLEHHGDPQAQLRGWLEATQAKVLDRFTGFYEVARVAADLDDTTPMSRRLLKIYKNMEREQIANLCRQAGYRDPAALADKLYLVVEGARLGLECIGPDGPGAQLVAAADSLIEAHSPLGVSRIAASPATLSPA